MCFGKEEFQYTGTAKWEVVLQQRRFSTTLMQVQSFPHIVVHVCTCTSALIHSFVKLNHHSAVRMLPYLHLEGIDLRKMSQNLSHL